MPARPTSPDVLRAEVTGEDIEAADGAMYELPLDTDTPAEVLRDAIAQHLAAHAARAFATGWTQGHAAAVSAMDWLLLEQRQRLAQLAQVTYLEDPTAAPAAQEGTTADGEERCAACGMLEDHPLHGDYAAAAAFTHARQPGHPFFATQQEADAWRAEHGYGLYDADGRALRTGQTVSVEDTGHGARKADLHRRGRVVDTGGSTRVAVHLEARLGHPAETRRIGGRVLRVVHDDPVTGQ